MKCKKCGNEIEQIDILQKNGKIYKANYFSKKPYNFNGVKHYRKLCEICIFDKLGRKPRKPNIVNQDYITILDFDEETKILFLNYLDERFGITEEKMIKKHGEKEGKLKWDSYREKQRLTNTFDYKNEKYGMTKEEFDDYNRSRSVTKENMIKRHGEKEGLLKWNDYVEKQRTHGCSLEWFIEKYGEKQGIKKYEEINKNKANNIKNYIKRYGEKEGIKKFKIYIQNKASKYYSKVSQDLFWPVYEKVKNDFQRIFFAELNQEYYLFNNDKKTIYFFDFLVKDNKKVIEFNGYYWHANKNNFNENDLINYPNNVQMLAKEVWEKDQIKLDFLKEQGYDYLIIWEDEFRNDMEKTINKCVRFIND